MEKIMLRVHEKHLKDNAVIGHSLRRFMRGRSCFTNLISFYDKVTHLADQGKPVGAIFLDSVKLLILFLTASFQTKCPACSWTKT